jgi:hypothetical protein
LQLPLAVQQLNILSLQGAVVEDVFAQAAEVQED